MRDDSRGTIQQVRERLLVLERERIDLLRQLDAHERQAFLDAPPIVGIPLGQPACSSIPATSDQRIELFLKLFRCRTSVYPKRWENATKNASGYAPACRNEWQHGVCHKPRVKCSECRNQVFLPLDEMAVKDHLLGKTTIGTYAIREDDTCVFLACDFDEKGWSEDVQAYRMAGLEQGIDVAIERSRSGNGAHAWIFFAELVPARLARVLGTMLLARTTEQRQALGVQSFDRFFPSQDYLPTKRHGFGNLIALPLQKNPRDKRNSVFLDAQMNVSVDQWAFLAGVRCLSLQELQSLVRGAVVAPKVGDNEADVSFETDRALIDKEDRIVKRSVPMELTLIRDEQIQIPLPGLPAGLVSRLKRLAMFPNPKFYERQRMRMPTYPEERFIFSGELRDRWLVLPRGLMDKATALLKQAGASVTIEERRTSRKGLKVTFSGTLTAEQAAGLAKMKPNDIGIVVMPPGSGKTVLGCALVAERKASTLILVLADRMDQVADLQRRVTVELERAGNPTQLFKIDSQMGVKVRRATHAAIAEACQGLSGVCIFATGSLVGEGFDLPVLDTLVLASPISFKGRVVQYTGRLHRESEGKTDVKIHDYLDASSPVMLKMYRKRRKQYEAMGYVIEKMPISCRPGNPAATDLFVSSKS